MTEDEKFEYKKWETKFEIQKGLAHLVAYAIIGVMIYLVLVI